MTIQIPARNTSKYSGRYSGSFDYHRIIEIFVDSHRIALSSKNPNTAGDRFALAVEVYHQIMSMKVPADVRESVQRAMETLADVFPTQVMFNEALGLREKALKLKTPKKQLELLCLARDVLDRGLAANPGSAVLQTAATELRVEISQLEAAAR